jgi:hypothetical protein
MSFLDGLSAALTAGTQGAAGWMEGQQKGRKEADERSRQAAAALRQKHIDEQNDLIAGYQISGFKRKEADAAREPADRAELESLLIAARSGDPTAIAKVIARRPDLADEFRAAKEGRKQVVDGQIVDVDAGTSIPIAGYEAPPVRATAADRLVQSQAFSAAQAAKGAYDSMLTRRPEARRPVMVDTEKGFVEDAAATADKRNAFSADSTAKAQDVQGAFAAARAVGAPVGLPTAVLTPIQLKAKEAISAINASNLPKAEKLRRIAGVNKKLASLNQ